MRTLLLTLAVAAIAGSGLSTASAQDTSPAMVAQTSLGSVLADKNGMTLYTYTRDMTGYSNCNDACAATWTPMITAPNAKASGDWTIITRDDGRKQWAYKGRALYAWTKDAKAGDAGGDGVAGGKWRVAKP